MIYELEKRDYNLLRPMLSRGFKFPEASSVVDLNNIGWVVVNDKENPTSALLWAQGLQGFFLLGDEKNADFLNDLNHFVDNNLNQRLQKEVNWFEVAGMHRDWDKVIEQVFNGRKVQKSTQFVYRWLENLDTIERFISSDPSSDYRVMKVNSQLIASSGIENIDFMISELLIFWGNIDNFLNSGIAYCVIQGNTIVSICYSGFVTGNTHTIGISTMEHYRNKGLAYQAACACIKEFRKKNITPYWDCSSDNKPSLRLAEKLGFVKEEEYNLFSIRI